MNYIKTFEGFLNPDTDEDKIALEYIKRLEKVKDNNPYQIKKLFEEKNIVGESIGYEVIFDDTPITVKQVLYYQLNGPNAEGNYKKFIFRLTVDCMGDKERVNCKKKYFVKLMDLIDKLYKKQRIDKINTNINPAADRLP